MSPPPRPISRPVAATDGALLAALHGEACPEAPWDEAWLGRLLAQPGVGGVVASVEGEPAGFILVRRAAEEAEILTLAVRPALARRGVGRQLVAAASAALAEAGVRRLVLEVAEANAPARALYAGFGFAEVGRRRGYYGPGRDALLLARALSPPCAG